MKKINLENILEDTEIGDEVQFDINHNGSGTTMYTKKAVLLLMKEACKQTLELAAENAYCSLEHPDDDNDLEESDYIVSKQSIIGTIKQVI